MILNIIVLLIIKSKFRHATKFRHYNMPLEVQLILKTFNNNLNINCFFVLYLCYYFKKVSRRRREYFYEFYGYFLHVKSFEFPQNNINSIIICM